MRSPYDLATEDYFVSPPKRSIIGLTYGFTTLLRLRHEPRAIVLCSDGAAWCNCNWCMQCLREVHGLDAWHHCCRMCDRERSGFGCHFVECRVGWTVQGELTRPSTVSSQLR